MSDTMNAPAFNRTSTITSDEIIRAALSDRRELIKRYVDISWKLRAGYVTLLYGALTLILGKDGIPNENSPVYFHEVTALIFVLILGFSFAAFVIDCGYVCKKVKLMSFRDALAESVSTRPESLEKCLRDDLLKTFGEIAVTDLHGKVKKEYEKKRNWIVFNVLLPYYGVSPLLAGLVWLCARRF